MHVIKCIIAIGALTVVFFNAEAVDDVTNSMPMFNASNSPTSTLPGNSTEELLFLTLAPIIWTFKNEAGLENDPDTVYLKSLLNYSALSDDDVTKDFIMTYSSELQRRIIATQLSYCPLVPLCSYGLDNTTYKSYHSCCLSCSCDQECAKYGNCCPDVKATPEQFFDVDIPQSCIPLHLRGDDTMSPFAFDAYGIATCPDTAVYVDSEKCVQDYRLGDVTIFDILPVWHNESKILYRNIHCALCNGISPKKLDVFEPEVGCYTSPKVSLTTESELIRYVLETSNCDIRYISTVTDMNYCAPSISQCNTTGLWLEYDKNIETACKMYQSVLTIGLTQYKNVFCAFCNGHVDIQRHCPYIQSAPASPFSFSGLLAISPRDDNDASDSGNQCGLGFVSHPKGDDCMRLRCSPGLLLVGDECVPLVETVSNFNYNVVLRLTLSARHTVTEAIHMADQVGNTLKEFFVRTLVDDPYHLIFLVCTAHMMLKTNAPCSQTNTINRNESELDGFLISLDFNFIGIHRQTFVASALSGAMRIDISNITGEQDETMDVHVVNRYEEDFSLGLLKMSQFYENWDDNFTFPVYDPIAHSFCGSFQDRLTAFLFPPVFMQDFCFSEGEDFTPISSFLPCPMLLISNESNPWLINDDGVLFVNSGHVFNHTQFYLSDNNTLLLCKDKFIELHTNIASLDTSLTMEHIISLVCSSLSIISLLITLVAFTVLTKLQTLPGKNNMALVVSLLLAQVMYLIGSYSGLKKGSVACKLIGVLTHFFWLLVVFWMNICTFHMFHVLTKTKVMSRGAGNKKYLLYHVYCILVSAIFVGINILVSSVTSGYSDIGYGVNSCYVSSQTMLVYTFGIPLAFSIFSNLGMFIYVIITIKKASAVQKNVKNERNDVAVFARLSTLTGITWVFGFVYMWTGLVVFSYIFIILNASQGVFLFVSFICTRRVFNIAEERYSMRSTSQRSSLGRTLTTTAE